MAGEKALDKLLKTMDPVLNEGKYVFCVAHDLAQVDASQLICSFREKEGLTAVITLKEAERLDLEYSFVAAWITLNVHSSLEAVGLTAAFSTALSDHGISCNVIAAYYHDHIFVDHAKAHETLAVLQLLSSNADY